MQAAIDIGNTFVKLGLFEGNNLVQAFEGLSPAEVLDHWKRFPITSAILSSVGQTTDGWTEALTQYTERIIVLQPGLPVPLVNRYQTPETLGADRIAASVGAKSLYPTEPCLAIDMGTCITYDYVDQDHQYWGGSISPGLRMRLKAMHTFTARLPLLEPTETEPELTGRNTREAMLSGAIFGMAAELNGIIESYRQKVPGLRIVGCGGDAAYFERRIKAPIFVVSKLVLIGLNRILQYNLTP